MSKPVFAQVKIVGDAADTIRTESERRGVSQSALVTELALDGISARSAPGGDNLERTERRIASTLLSLRGEVERVAASTEMCFAFVDALAKMLLLHLPEPASDTREGLLTSAENRYNLLLNQVAVGGFDGDRPVAIARLVELMGANRAAVADE